MYTQNIYTQNYHIHWYKITKNSYWDFKSTALEILLREMEEHVHFVQVKFSIITTSLTHKNEQK